MVLGRIALKASHEAKTKWRKDMEKAAMIQDRNRTLIYDDIIEEEQGNIVAILTE